MRTTTVRLAALAALGALLLGGSLMGQQPGNPPDKKKPAEEKKPSQLEEMIAQALKDNPDVRVAEAKMREAEAVLDRARLQAVQKVVTAQHSIETLDGGVKNAQARALVAEANLKAGEAEYQRLADLVKKGVVPKAEIDVAQAKLEQLRADLEISRGTLQSAKADLAKAQAELPYLLGKKNKDPARPADPERIAEDLNQLIEMQNRLQRRDYAVRVNAAYALLKADERPRGDVADKLRKSLDGPVHLKVEEQPLSEVLEYLQRLTDVSVVSNALNRERLAKKITVDLNNIPVGAAFQFLEDLAGVQFAVRDYGVLVTEKLPPGMLSLHDFWKGGDKPKAAEEKPSSPQKPSGKP